MCHQTEFLIYRVELKASILLMSPPPLGLFLIYRVELKGVSKTHNGLHELHVPNLPCGVESTRSVVEFCESVVFLIYRVELQSGVITFSIFIPVIRS